MKLSTAPIAIITTLASAGLLSAGYGVVLAINAYASETVWLGNSLVLTSVALLGASIFAVESVEKSHR